MAAWLIGIGSLEVVGRPGLRAELSLDGKDSACVLTGRSPLVRRGPARAELYRDLPRRRR